MKTAGLEAGWFKFLDFLRLEARAAVWMNLKSSYVWPSRNSHYGLLLDQHRYQSTMAAVGDTFLDPCAEMTCLCATEQHD